jgi:predicted ATPase with chaperone activity
MVARRLPTILPDLTLPDALDTTRIHSEAFPCCGLVREHQDFPKHGQ